VNICGTAQCTHLVNFRPDKNYNLYCVKKIFVIIVPSGPIQIWALLFENDFVSND